MIETILETKESSENKFIISVYLLDMTIINR